MYNDTKPSVNFEHLKYILTDDFKIKMLNNKINIQDYLLIEDKALLAFKTIIAKDLIARGKSFEEKKENKKSLIQKLLKL